MCAFRRSETLPPPPSPPPSGDAAQSHPLNPPPRTKACIIYGCAGVLYLSAHCAPTEAVIDNRRRRLFTINARRGSSPLRREPLGEELPSTLKYEL